MYFNAVVAEIVDCSGNVVGEENHKTVIARNKAIIHEKIAMFILRSQ